MPYPITVLTLFPEMILQAVSHSIIGRAIGNEILDIKVLDIRDFATDKHKTVDDEPYGGGAGMVMKVDVVVAAIREAKKASQGAKVVLMSASGRPFNQAVAKRYASHLGGIILVCGHYEGIDERVAAHYVDEEVSVGDFVLSGGEIPALAILDATARLLPGVLGNAESLDVESHENGLLESPQYTRPQVFEGHEVPAVLLSGNHKEIELFRTKEAIEKTKRMRPDIKLQLEPEPPPMQLGRPRELDNG
ncbi:MAG: tRNA (guanosine(37)-N1)-methyltransferase TrmD [Myxococcota bacterium]|jgi:tRNA (guanine37-N1)-methyltransferase|nr:tRNA (guanosine(37)-N1)-methyltransferase TrmD [Myxococcota bacterium]MBP8972000.1 tRNA (guanosine(37)-N1)-methyltransferase TrmD [Myxococcota bacterium]OQC43025.1 MAG: tRNA (guanine-N(1)-)-methyltransferase [Deltaproteobacteria bacterium ADurb.Bin058]HHW97678.1 tRNA (guanosine(37)-N1)-methyltransferase TrmD [Oligoflexales bacterium]HQL56336.1 tRNA (guanosine(37)-N1)-methyltransferase TrmD [Myxococcota bacterium]